MQRCFFTTHQSPLTTHPAMGMVEAVVAILIVGVLLVSALNTVAASRTGFQKIGERGRGAMLAQQLMAEILPCAYEDPVAGSILMGPDLLETDGTRAAFNDVDDYNGWSETPPTLRNGTMIPNYEGWERSVAVGFVDSDELTTTALSDTGVKRITVTVKHQGRMASVWTAVRTSAASPLIIESPKKFRSL